MNSIWITQRRDRPVVGYERSGWCLRLLCGFKIDIIDLAVLEVVVIESPILNLAGHFIYPGRNTQLRAMDTKKMLRDFVVSLPGLSIHPLVTLVYVVSSIRY